MTILNRLYASSGSEVIIDTLQIKVGEDTYWLTKGWQDITATLEDGSVQTFTACGIDIALPARNADGTQDLKFVIGNIDGVVSEVIKDALSKLYKGSLTYRKFVSTDLSGPAEKAYTLAVKSGYWTATAVQLTAGYLNILDTAWPRKRYNLVEHPGLRYIS